MKRSASNFDIDEEIANLPPGLERALLRILSERVGRENAIDRWELVNLLEDLGVLPREAGKNLNDRRMRACISQIDLEKKAIICNLGDGYFMASGWKEFRQVTATEKKRAVSVLEKLRAMEETAERLWGEAQQLELFG